MKIVRKLTAALLVLSLVLAVTCTAMAASKWDKYQIVKFTKNTVAYKTKGGKATSTIVRKGSYAQVKRDCGNWVQLYLTLDETVTRWFKKSNLKTCSQGKYSKTLGIYLPVYVMYSQGGVGLSYTDKALVLDDADPVDETDWNNYRISPDCMKHVKATASVWMHKESSLKKNYGRALHKGDKVTYRRKWGFDSRFVIFYGIKYHGKCLWVSSVYSKLVK